MAGQDERDLRAQECAVDPEERDQRVVTRIATGLAVAREHGARRERRAERLEVHQEERQIAADVGHAQRRVELQAVDDLDAMLEEHVLGAKVAVTITDAPGRDTKPELATAGGEEGTREAGQPRDLARERAVRRELEQRVDVLAQGVLQGGGRVRAVALRHRVVELREPPADRDERRVRHAAVGHARRECPRLIEATHLDHVVDRVRVVRGCERDAARHGDDRLDSEV